MRHKIRVVIFFANTEQICKTAQKPFAVELQYVFV